jgi:tripartite-type tricarboxylate transporter receptor subunit TctC
MPKHQRKQLEMPQHPRRLFCLLLASTLLAGSAHAQSYPAHPVRVVVPFAAGGSVDVLTRLLADHLSKRWGQTVIVDNRPGAAGNLAAETVARSAPDGLTLFICAAAFAVNATLYTKLRFDPKKDFVPVAMIGSTGNVLTVTPELPVKSVRELIALAKTKPGVINYSSTGVGTSGHLTVELFKTMAGINLTHVPYRSVGQSMTDLMTGVVSVAMPSIPGAAGHITSGKLRGLAVSGATRSSALPDLPTMAEAGLPGYDASTWYAVLAPAGVAREIVAKINSDIAAFQNDPAIKAQLSRRGIDPVTMTPERLGAYIDSEITKWAQVVKDAHIKVD